MANFVQVNPLDYSDASVMSTKTYHGLEIRIGGNVVGRITKWTRPALGRDVTPVRELTAPGQSNGSFGRIIEMVPGKTTDESNKLSITRVEVWGAELELAFGYPATFIDLADQTRPFQMTENLYKGTNLYQQWNYAGCWFSTLGTDDFSTDGTALVQINAEISFCSRTKMIGP